MLNKSSATAQRRALKEAMESPEKPRRYTDDEWEVVKDLAEPDVLIPYDEFPTHLRLILESIIRLAERLQTDTPPVVSYLASQSDENLRVMQGRIDSTYLEIQLWCGDMKLDIVERSRVAKR